MAATYTLSVNAANTQVTVTFSAEVFDASNASIGDLQASDFQLSIPSGPGGPTVASTPTSVNKISQSGSSSIYVLGLNISGTPSHQDILEVSVKHSNGTESAFLAGSTPAVSTQAQATPLTDKEAPHITNTSVADVGGQPLQKTVTVEFNEDLVNSNSANPQSLNNGDSLVANDFNFSLKALFAYSFFFVVQLSFSPVIFSKFRYRR